MKTKKIWFKENLVIPQVKASALGGQAREKLKALRREILELLQQERFVSFQGLPHVLFDNQLNCLWHTFGFQASSEDLYLHLDKIKVHAFKRWGVPDLASLKTLKNEPLFQKHAKFGGSDIYSSEPAEGDDGGHRIFSLDDGASRASSDPSWVIPLHQVGQREVFSFMVANSLVPKGIPGIQGKLQELFQFTMMQNKKDAGTPTPSIKVIQQHLLNGDYIRARLPVLEPAYLQDMEKGLWEIHFPEPPPGSGWVEVELEEPWEARDPQQDVREGAVAIDFGTSSTVVACREQGKSILLRVGMNDFFKEPSPEDYENPTVLEFKNLPSLMASWNAEPYRPLTRWEDVHFSHEARKSMMENEANQDVIASILPGLKQWPLNASQERPLRLTDQSSKVEMMVTMEKTPMPVPGERLSLTPEDPFDPIELYAYYLGLFINHRSAGLFLEYYMTFPITYPKEVKKKILASFARGLSRSLPATLITTPAFERFQVREEASEPAAYAACALEELEIEPTEAGIAYAVFDFGGGTTDFDYGIHRLPSDAERDQGYEAVIEHFGASGDTYLGGENLMSHLVYLTFQHNLEVCRQNQISFACPPDAERFPGHELFIDFSHVAQTNTSLLMSKVREVWQKFDWEVDEGGDGEVRRRRTDLIGDEIRRAAKGPGFRLDPDAQSRASHDGPKKESLELLNRDRQVVTVEFGIDWNKLNHFLVERVGRGVHHFLAAMKEAFAERETPQEDIHVLLAGNASRSPLVQSLFVAALQEKLMGWNPPPEGGAVDNEGLDAIGSDAPFNKFILHRPPVGDPGNPYKPTAKTGVAIGLLKLIPGEKLLVVSPTKDNEDGEAPFRFFVGGFSKEIFGPSLKQNGAYHAWESLGPPTRGAYILAYSTSPQATLGTLERGSRDLSEKKLLFPPGTEDRTLFVQATGPSQIEVCLARSAEEIEERPEEAAYRQVIDLK